MRLAVLSAVKGCVFIRYDGTLVLSASLGRYGVQDACVTVHSGPSHRRAAAACMSQAFEPLARAVGAVRRWPT